MYRVDVTVRAEQDLDRIVAYIAGKLVSPKAAADFVDAVYDCYDHLENNPYEPNQPHHRRPGPLLPLNGHGNVTGFIDGCNAFGNITLSRKVIERIDSATEMVVYQVRVIQSYSIVTINIGSPSFICVQDNPAPETIVN